MWDKCQEKYNMLKNLKCCFRWCPHLWLHSSSSSPMFSCQFHQLWKFLWSFSRRYECDDYVIMERHKSYQFFIVRHPGYEVCQLIVIHCMGLDQLLQKLICPPKYQKNPKNKLWLEFSVLRQTWEEQSRGQWWWWRQQQMPTRRGKEHWS